MSEIENRLIPLHDGSPGLRETLSVEIREPSPSSIENQNSKIENPILDFTASDATLDRYGEIIVPAGWKLNSYNKNPVFQNAHQYDDIIFTLGRALVTEIRSAPSSNSNLPSSTLFQRIQFATDFNPLARIAYGLYKGKFLSAVSVGFIPLRWENGSAELGYRRKYLEQELLEVSAVAIPANPNALALAYKSGALEKSDLRETVDLLRQTLSGSPLPAGRGEGKGEGLKALNLLRHLHSILKHT